MPSDVQHYAVFIASPGGLDTERKAFRRVLGEYTEDEAKARGYAFDPLGWEDTTRGRGRAQALINEDVRASDFFVLVLGDRWGTPPTADEDGYTSGTEEEYDVAMACMDDRTYPMRQMLILFKGVSPEKLSDPGDQLKKVLAFKRRVEEERLHFYDQFDTEREFERIIRRHLSEWLRGIEGGTTVSPTPPPSEPVDSPDADEQGATEGPEHDILAKAWALAGEGRAVEAEVEFARALMRDTSAETLLSYARYLQRVGRLDQARMYIGQVIEDAEARNDETIASRAYNSLGVVLATRGDLDGAEAMHRKALEIDERLGRQEGIAIGYGNLGNLLRTGGDLDGAEAMYRKALEIYERLGHQEGMANAYGNLGLVLAILGDLNGAEAMHRKALEIDERLGRQEGMASHYGNLGLVSEARGDLDGAEAMYRKALEIYERLGRQAGIAIGYGNLGLVLATRGDLDGAESLYRKALVAAEQLGAPQKIEWAKGRLESLAALREESGGDQAEGGYSGDHAG